MSNAEQPTCGKGLAENSILPANLGTLLAAMAENLAVHMKALDLTDPNSRAEHDAYEKLVHEIREVSTRLGEIATEMAGYIDLPMGRHNEQTMTHPIVRATFQTFVTRKRELSSLLNETLERDNQLLKMMQAHSR